MARLLFNQIVNECTSAIRQLAYGVNVDFLDEYMQMSERSSNVDHFCQVVMEIYGPEYLRKPTVNDVEKLYRHHEEKHGFSGIYCVARLMDMSCFLWCCWVERRHQRFISIPLFNDLKTGRAPEIFFVANDVTYPWGYYLVNGIYSELATLVKTIPEPVDDDHRRILYKLKQESARKDVK
nr:hypothetical protein [Tanacetum cinerariifolium]